MIATNSVYYDVLVDGDGVTVDSEYYIEKPWDEVRHIARRFQEKYPKYRVIVRKSEEFEYEYCENEDYEFCSNEEPKYLAYKEVDREYKLQDAKRHILWKFKTDEDDDSQYARETLKQFDLEQLVDDFEMQQDCNVSENATWESVIGDYIWNLKHDDDDDEE